MPAPGLLSEVGQSHTMAAMNESQIPIAAKVIATPADVFPSLGVRLSLAFPVVVRVRLSRERNRRFLGDQ